MLSAEMKTILSEAGPRGWVMEPEAKRLLGLAGLPVPRFVWANSVEEAQEFALETGFPVAAKIVSPKIVHKSDVGGVVLGIDGPDRLKGVFERFSGMEGFQGVMVEETLKGVEMIAGAKLDTQFGPVVVFGMGGVGVEIYQDTAIRMAPLTERDVDSMLRQLKAHPMLEGFRGRQGVDRAALTRTLVTFSQFVMDLEPFMESMDINPLMCSPDGCVVGDARILLTGE